MQKYPLYREVICYFAIFRVMLFYKYLHVILRGRCQETNTCRWQSSKKKLCLEVICSSSDVIVFLPILWKLII